MSPQKTKLSLLELRKAQKSFEEFRLHLESDQLKAGAIQAFEYCFELTWKTMKRFLEVYVGETLNGSRDTIRAAAKEKLIDTVEIWFDFVDARNITTHEYEETSADDVIDLFPRFSIELESCIQRITTRMKDADATHGRTPL